MENKEGFLSANYFLQTNIIVKTILFALLYYIISNTLSFNYLKTKLPRFIETNVFQTILFGLMYYLISINL